MLWKEVRRDECERLFQQKLHIPYVTFPWSASQFDEPSAVVYT
jgi:hypothetical protein